MNGVLIIDKPEGLTSHDVVSRCRRILKTRRIGHTGTLDPFATGVLVILVGRATRLAQFLDKDVKEYEAFARFGFETDTGDRTGTPKSEIQSPKSISIAEIEKVLSDFRGEILQTPPMYSAKKIEGKKLYELARKGIEIERKPVKVMIFELEILPQKMHNSTEKEKNGFGLWTLDFGLRISCSAGTYIRTLAEDIGRRIGTGAHLAELRRTRAGRFDLSKAVTIEELEEIASKGELDKILISMSESLSHLPQILLNEGEIAKTRNGLKLKKPDFNFEDNQPLRMTDAYENLIAVGFYDEKYKTIQPKIVLV